MIKITSSLFVALLLYPVARTFYEMCLFEREAEVEERPADWPPPSTDGGESASFGVMLSQTYYAITPFDRLRGLIGYGPRKWVGALGLSGTILIFLLLVYSAFSPLKGAFHSYEWKDDGEDLEGFDSPPGSVIIGGFNADGTAAIERNTDEQNAAGQPAKRTESK